MPTAVKNSENMTKHLTQAEIAAREAAEQAFLPDRHPKKCPRALKNDALAKRIWKETLQRMAGLGIVDILDTDTLALYCMMSSRHQALQDLYAKEADGIPDVKEMREIRKELQSLEVAILSYASKLGLTPEARVRLAKRAAEQEEEGEDADLFA